jgi:hypothetical protein
MIQSSRSPRESCLRKGVSRFRKLFGTDVRTPVISSATIARVLGVCLLALPTLGFAQQFSDSGDSQAALPDMPQAAQPSTPQSSSPQASSSQTSSGQTNPDERLPQTKRILGIVPNFRAVSTDEQLPPQTVKEKFMDATHD